MQVLTHNVASALGILNANEIKDGLDDYHSSAELSFLNYMFYLKTELFARFQKLDQENANIDLNKVDEICWFLCAKKYLVRENKVLTDDEVYKLWRVFNSHIELDSDGELLYPVVIESEELAFILQSFMLAAGKVVEPGTVEGIVTPEKQYR